jgi:hypothetical protein
LEPDWLELLREEVPQSFREYLALFLSRSLARSVRIVSFPHTLMTYREKQQQQQQEKETEGKCEQKGKKM